MKRIDQQTVQRILDSIDIVEVVGDFVELKRRGSNYMGLCPFHSERTPSFSVNRARGICKCFSCGEGGNAVNFVMKIKQCNYGEALRYLAAKYNIEIKEAELTEEELRQRQERDALYAALEAVDAYFRAMTATPEGRNAISVFAGGRTMPGHILQKTGVGYAPSGPLSLLRSLETKGFTASSLQAAGVLYADNTPVFAGIPTVAVRNRYGRVVGFVPLAVGEEPGLPVMPDTALWHREEVLAGIWEARGAIGKAGHCVIAQSVSDLPWLYESGIDNAVALVSPGFGEQRVRSIKKLTSDVTVILPVTKRGIFEQLRASVPLLADEINVKVVSLPAGIQAFTASRSSEAVEAALRDEAVDMVIYRINALRRAGKDSSQGAYRMLFDDLVFTLRNVRSPLLKEAYVHEWSDACGRPAEQLARLV